MALVALIQSTCFCSRGSSPSPSLRIRRLPWTRFLLCGDGGSVPSHWRRRRRLHSPPAIEPETGVCVYLHSADLPRGSPVGPGSSPKIIRAGPITPFSTILSNFSLLSPFSLLSAQLEFRCERKGRRRIELGPGPDCPVGL